MSREAEIRVARVYLAQARAFRERGSRFSWVLLRWAGDARKRAARPADADDAQPDLFSEAAA